MTGYRNSLSGSAALAVLLVVSCIVIVVVGGCVAYKVDRKVKEWQERQATNEDQSLRPSQWPLPSNAPPGARALTLFSAVRDGAEPVLQVSTNLVDWVDAPGWTNNLPVLFFRYRP